jgi:hypothetical protein
VTTDRRRSEPGRRILGAALTGSSGLDKGDRAVAMSKGSDVIVGKE